MDKSERYLPEVGKSYGKLTVSGVLHSSEWRSFMPNAKYLRPVVEARCECGGVWRGKLNALKTGNTTSCGCSHKYAEHSDEVGKKYGRLTILAIQPRDEWVRVHSKQRGRDVLLPTVTASCDCGSVWVGRLYAVRQGATKSCGCLNRENLLKPKYVTHGMYNSREYRAYRAMLRRCLNPKHKSFQDYGGRGITVCERWKESFEVFYADMGPSPGSGYSIDRIDNNLGYTPDNCRWGTAEQQNNNRRSCHYVEYGGEKLTVSQLARKLGVHRRTLTDWIARGKI